MYIKFIYLYYHNANILPIILAIHFHFLNSDQVEIYEIYDNTIVFYYHAMSMQIPLHHCKCLPKLKIINLSDFPNYLNNYKILTQLLGGIFLFPSVNPFAQI